MFQTCVVHQINDSHTYLIQHIYQHLAPGFKFLGTYLYKINSYHIGVQIIQRNLLHTTHLYNKIPSTQTLYELVQFALILHSSKKSLNFFSLIKMFACWQEVLNREWKSINSYPVWQHRMVIKFPHWQLYRSKQWSVS